MANFFRLRSSCAMWASQSVDASQAPWRVLLDHHPPTIPNIMPFYVTEVRWSEEHLRRQNALLGATLRYLGTLMLQ